MKRIAVLFFVLVPCIVAATERSPYAGEEVRSIRSLSKQEIESLRTGDGMGFAKLAELNHFPGPKHVLEVADELGLSPQQLAETRSVYEKMLRNAVLLGERIVKAESRLDREFEQGTISPESLEVALLEIGKLRAQLRFVHLRAHLSQARLLKPEQIQDYDALRGYGATSHDHRRDSTTRD